MPAGPVGERETVACRCGWRIRPVRLASRSGWRACVDPGGPARAARATPVRDDAAALGLELELELELELALGWGDGSGLGRQPP
jgi:hypothetical protein